MSCSSKPMALLAAAAILLAGASAAQAEYPSDVEGARMNARAGGPTNAHDAELLKRWGATSASPTRHAAPERSRTKQVRTRTRDDR